MTQAIPLDPIPSVYGETLYAHRWQPVTTIRGFLVLVHGVAEHSGRYAETARRLAEHGYAVYAYDQYGHGRSPGQRAFVDSIEGLADDLHTYVVQVYTETGQWPYLLGHSMGALVALVFALEHPNQARGLILSGTPVAIVQTPAPLIALVQVLNRVAPGVPAHKIDKRKVANEADRVQGYEDDPLNYQGALPARTLHSLINASQRVLRDAGQIRLPLLVLHGAADRLTLPVGAEWLYERAGSDDKGLRWYADMAHEILFSIEAERVISDMVDWLDARTEPARQDEAN